MYRKLFKQTVIYGLATVLPRMFSFILVPLYTDVLPVDSYGAVSILFSYLVLFNVLLSYGMETAFFRFYTHEENKDSVLGTSMITVFWTSILFLLMALLFRHSISEWSNLDVENITYTIWILALDALVLIPFSKLRVDQRPVFYAILKILNVIINLGLNVFFLLILPRLSSELPNTLINTLYVEDFQVGYIFLSNVIASLFTFLLLSPHYFKIRWTFDFSLWWKMMKYGFPVLIAGIAFAVNETFDRIILEWMSPKETSMQIVGAYSACYKLALFMTLFATAFRLGIEPFFFTQSKNEDAPNTYAIITKYYIIFGSVILLTVIVFADILKLVLIKNPDYWQAMKVVPLIILANLFLGIYHNLSVWYKLTDKTKIGAYISIVGAVVTLALNFYLIPIMSYYGSAIATLAAYGVMMLISYLLGKKYYPIPYDIKSISLYLFLSILLSAVSFYFFRENYYVGVLLLFVFVYFVYRNEKQIILAVFRKK
jgi:O-antigen/teichoic acid export membrane protein